MSEPTVEGYLAVAHHFQLGRLPTECSNPTTATLSQLCTSEATLPEGLTALQQVDIDALELILHHSIAQTVELAKVVHDVLTSGKKVVCEGCGATGRLSISLEVFAREGMVEPEYREKIIGFMAGGDAAFIRSIESFEDKTEYGERQLHAVGFEDGDLLMAITEGGETPFVIAACEEAVRVSPSRDPYFLYCNPDDVLVQVAERSKRVLENPRIQKINLCVGPMSITGSTRMQATTVQVLVAGLAIRFHANPDKIRPAVESLVACTKATLEYGVLAPFTWAEADMYRNKEYFLYETDYFAVTVMTDTTERAPTFSMPPYESYNNPTELASQVYLTLPGVSGAEAGWERLLRRPIRPLEWEETFTRTGRNALLGYDISTTIADKRRERLGAERTQLRAVVALEGNSIIFSLPHKAIKIVVPLPDAIVEDILLVNVVAKMLLNAHSTAVMGVLQRYEGNVMTWVRPSNNKLIDRAARYIKLLLERRWAAQGASQEAIQAALPSYEAICRRVYQLRETTSTDQPIVLITVDEFAAKIITVDE